LLDTIVAVVVMMIMMMMIDVRMQIQRQLAYRFAGETLINMPPRRAIQSRDARQVQGSKRDCIVVVHRDGQ